MHHTIEDLVGGLTVGELAAKAGITIATLVERVTPRAVRIVEPSQPTRTVALPALPNELKPKVAKPAGKPQEPLPAQKQGFALQVGQLDRLVLKFLAQATAPVKAFAVLADVDPSGSHVTGEDVRRSLMRLHALGKVTFTGNTKARTYSLVTKKRDN